MMKFNKDYNLKIFSLLVACLFLVTSISYGIDLSDKSNLRKQLSFNTENEKPRIVCALLAEIYHNCIVKFGLSPEEALRRLKAEMYRRNVEALGIRLGDNTDNIRIYHKAPIVEDSTYIEVYNDGQFVQRSEKDSKDVALIADLENMGQTAEGFMTQLRLDNILSDSLPLYDSNDGEVMDLYRSILSSATPKATSRDTTSWDEIKDAVAAHLKMHPGRALIIIEGAARHIWGGAIFRTDRRCRLYFHHYT